MPASDTLPALLSKAIIRRLFVPVGLRTLDRWISAGTFPPPDLRLNAKAVFWRRETVESWIERQAQEGGGR